MRGGDRAVGWPYTILVFLVVSFVFALPLLATKPSFETILQVAFLAILTGFPLALVSAYVLTPLSIWRLRPRTLDDRRILDILEELSRKARMKTPKLLLLETPEANAFAYQSILGKRIVVTRGLVDAYERGELSEEELKSILAHELGHHKNGDCLRNSLVFSFVSLFDVVAEFFIISGMVSIGWSTAPWIDEEARSQYYLGGLALVVVGILLKVPAKLASIIAFHHRRKLEFVADAFAARLTSPRVFASALQKIDRLNAELAARKTVTLPFPDGWTLRPRNISPIDRLFETHPSVESRVRALFGESA